VSDQPGPPGTAGGNIFISHSSRDRKMAETISGALERRGFHCWISSRDIGPGENFQEAIVRAIRSSRVMVLVFTGNANNSNEIKKEMALASQHNLSVIPIRVEDVVPNDAFTYEFATRQWIDAFQNWDQAVDRLSQQVNMVLRGSGGGGTSAPVAAAPVPAPAPPASRRTAAIAGAAIVLLAVVAAGAYVAFVRAPAGTPAPLAAASAPIAPQAAPPPQPAAVTPPAPPPMQQAVATPPPPAPETSPALVPGKTFRDCADCPAMVVVPAGEFMMGDEAGPPAEKPAHRVRVAAPFAVAKFHATRGDYELFIQATGHASDGCDFREGNNWRPLGNLSWHDPGFPQNNRHPVVCVSWDDAVAYAKWLSQLTGKPYRLLTEAEWEYAARAGTTTRFYWGDDQSQICTYENVVDDAYEERFGRIRDVQCRDGFVFTSPVGSFKPNPFGLHDMLGNAFQWVSDCWTENYDRAPADASIAVVAGGACAHTARGANWYRNPDGVRSSLRFRDEVGRRGTVIGFRVARDLGEQPSAPPR
jgi:formylglycine-generating enzyme required for sulfatase activity